ncbi:hypothetical protein GCM10007860_31880 [Chitiniphilus shinanonensis]|uniref:Type VI secretion protein n=1 Tax=Chitiniphilus shinanonensis TaxID=553088 RepID=A0ABQ6BVL0_9NEIS|nr:hypothetical protein [Chitiniphilus shinanonensis]GLS06023.1 hypothetical protein GCM10007860_31880 [Chitiniphilus shinanonensis]
MKRYAVGLLLAIPLLGHAADDVKQARLTLKKWGLAYCLSTYQKTETAKEASQAVGAYFQLGGHADGAYNNVEAYFNKAIPEDKKVMQATGKTNNLMRCLDAYEAPAYNKLIIQQDKFIGAEME